MKITILISLFMIPAFLLSGQSNFVFQNGSIHSQPTQPRPMPTVTLREIRFDKETAYLECPALEINVIKYCPEDQQKIAISVIADGADEAESVYHYQVSGGSIAGSGSNVSWDFSKVAPGNYSVTVEIENHDGRRSNSLTKSIEVRECPECVSMGCGLVCDCAEISVVSLSENARNDQEIIFEVKSTGGSQGPASYNWTVSGGEIIRGQGESKITVKVTNHGGEKLQAFVDIGGLCNNCPTEATLSLPILY